MGPRSQGPRKWEHGRVVERYSESLQWGRDHKDRGSAKDHCAAHAKQNFNGAAITRTAEVAALHLILTRTS